MVGEEDNYPLGPWSSADSWVDRFWSSVVSEILGIRCLVVVSPLALRIHWKQIHYDLRRFVGADAVLIVKRLIRPDFRRIARNILNAMRGLHGRGFDERDVAELAQRLRSLWTAWCVVLWKKYGVLFIFKKPNMWIVGGDRFVGSGCFESWLPLFSRILKRDNVIYGGVVQSHLGMWALLNSFPVTVADIELVESEEIVEYFRSLSRFRRVVLSFWRTQTQEVVVRKKEEEGGAPRGEGVIPAEVVAVVDNGDVDGEEKEEKQEEEQEEEEIGPVGEVES